MNDEKRVQIWVEKLNKPENLNKPYPDFWDENKSQIVNCGGKTACKLTLYSFDANLLCSQAAQKLLCGDEQ
jgi:hypothetical protein